MRVCCCTAHLLLTTTLVLEPCWPANTILPTLNGIPEKLDLIFNFDGVEAFDDSNQGSFWFVTGCIVGLNIEPFISGIFMGEHKPASSNEFLRMFVAEIETIKREFIFKEKNITINIKHVSADKPAYAYVCCTKYFNGYGSCLKCLVRGKYINKRMSFPDQEEDLRTDQSFREKLQ